MFLIFNLCIFTSAFLLFLVQPMVANILLPKVGGSPNIWNTCSVFFQISLLVGYLYSYLVSQKLSLKKQIAVHCCLLFCALLVINFHFQNEQIEITAPIADTLSVLFKKVFFPFVLLSTTSPLVQHWLSSSNLKERKNPYSLYVCSNIGSLLALYAYPLIFEKQLTISLQGTMWHVMFGAFFLSVVVLGLYLNKSVSVAEEKKEERAKSKINPVAIVYWIFFAFVPSSLMLGVTSHLSTDIGGLPFLWILPLSLYLLSFIWTFSRFYTPEIAAQFRRLYKAAAIVAIFLFCNAAMEASMKDNLVLIAIHCVFYFIFATYCHGVLANKKPAPEHLTLFYLCLAVGGALGGSFNTFVAPYIFTSISEYPFVIALSLLFVVSNLSETKRELLKIMINAVILCAVVIGASYLNITIEQKFSQIIFYAGLCLVLLFIFIQKMNFFLIGILSCLFMVLFFKENPDIVFKKRNFLGTVTVENIEAIPPYLNSMLLIHGDTIHGRQDILNKEYVFNPSAYYGERAAVKDFFKAYKNENSTIAWFGLGSGAIICYTQPENKHDVFEIDQDIIDVSTKYHYFRYLEHCAPEAAIKLGDARIEISKEADKKYDLIVFDAFSSHFIPVHLVTKEAVETYRSKLKDNGVILFHISSRAFDVEPVLTRIADELGMTFIVRNKSGADSYPQWGVLSNDKDVPVVKDLLAMEGWREGKMSIDTQLWTDDFHNLLSVLRK